MSIAGRSFYLFHPSRRDPSTNHGECWYASREHPEIIQGGMGVGVSSWSLARAVALQGQLGVVSGTAVDITLIRRLWDGDPLGDFRRAMQAFPLPEFVDEVMGRFYRADRADHEPFPILPLHKPVLNSFQERLMVLANFVEVFLAKEGHSGPVGINYLTKIQLPTLPSLYGALAGVDYVLMGAGIPREIPGVLDALVEHAPASIRFDILGGTGAEDEALNFDPSVVWSNPERPTLTRPKFLPIVSSDSLATMMTRKANGRVDGFIIEENTAGGHNAPPRGGGTKNERGEPLYGERDQANLDKVAALGLPFWLAGGVGTPQQFQEAKAAGAAGIQVGTLFAYAVESGVRADLREKVLNQVRRGEADVMTDGRASPTGFPFKTVMLDDTLSDDAVYAARARICDVGYLRAPYRREDGRIAFRCPSEPVDTFVKKGGSETDTDGRKCLCNALIANTGFPQVRDGGVTEAPLLTSGDDLKLLGGFLGERTSYTAVDVIEYLLTPA
ncbi:MAG: nitronate monooxygenase [Gemmatimonadetes bacterium]|nr:nitronate monooxygenase [Gemmatimonadota bacterium]